MSWLTTIIGYLIGAIPTAYIAGRLLKGKDIRQLGDHNIGAQNAFRELSPAIGISVGIIDACKGALAILIARGFGVSLPAVMVAGVACVVGHNWPVFLGFRGGRGESPTIGIFYVLLTQPMLILSAPALLALILTRNVIVASVFFFVPLPLVAWWRGANVAIIIYCLGLLFLVAFTHFLRVRNPTVRQA